MEQRKLKLMAQKLDDLTIGKQLNDEAESQMHGSEDFEKEKYIRTKASLKKAWDD